MTFFPSVNSILWEGDPFSRGIPFTAMLPFDDFDASTDDADFPVETYRALKYALADDLADEVRYNVTMEQHQKIKLKAIESKEEAWAFSGETVSVFME